MNGGNASNGAQNFSNSPSIYPGGVPDGSNAAFLDNPNTALYQNLSSNLEVGTYTLTAYVGWRLDDTSAPTYDLRFVVNGTILADSGSVALVHGGFVPVTVTYTATASDPFLGGGLRVSIQNTPGSPSQVDVDNFTLNFTAASVVPEPSSLVMVGIASTVGLGYAGIRRRAKVVA